MTPLPWLPGAPPLMLAPMQGVTNRAVRALLIAWSHPDVVFTEFARVRHGGGGARLAPKDVREARGAEHGVPLVVQLIGRDPGPLVEAAEAAQQAGAVHLNLNLGCPFGRMNPGSGGALLQRPEALADILPALRAAIPGTFSVKVRAGFSDPEQIFSLLPLFEAARVDFLVLHPRTVAQGYEGEADHGLTARVVQRTHLPVIANGDVRTAADARRVLAQSGAAGLMIGRGAVADPLLFERIRGRTPEVPSAADRAALLARYLGELLARYSELFCGDAQALANLRTLLTVLEEQDPAAVKLCKRLRKAKSAQAFEQALRP